MWCKNNLSSKCSYAKEFFELKKEFIFEKDYKSKCMVIHAILSEREKVDNDLQRVEIGDGSTFICVLFRNLTSKARISSLHINNVNNTAVKYKFINKSDIEDEFKYNNVTGALRDVILSVKVGNTPIFTGVEQESRKYRNQVYLLMTLRLRTEAQNWIRENFGTTLVFTNGKERKCSVELKLINNSAYDNKLNKFVTTTITYKNA